MYNRNVLVTQNDASIHTWNLFYIGGFLKKCLRILIFCTLCSKMIWYVSISFINVKSTIRHQKVVNDIWHLNCLEFYFFLLILRFCPWFCEHRFHIALHFGLCCLLNAWALCIYPRQICTAPLIIREYKAIISHVIIGDVLFNQM